MEAIKESSFTLFIKTNENIIGVACITIYKHHRQGYMWEISYICSDINFKGVGSMLVDKIKTIGKTYKNMLPIILYGLGLYPDSQKLYLRNGFVNNSFTISGGKKNIKRRRTYKPKYKVKKRNNKNKKTIKV